MPGDHLAFFSRQLIPLQQKYSAFDQELLALYLAVQHFRYFLEARSFTVFTDHKPLTSAFAKSTDPWSPSQQRHLAYIAEFTTDVQHVAVRTTRWQMRCQEPQSIAYLSNLEWTTRLWLQHRKVMR